MASVAKLAVAASSSPTPPLPHTPGPSSRSPPNAQTSAFPSRAAPRHTRRLPAPERLRGRRIQDEAFPGTSADISFKLNYPAFSQFVAVVSDSTGFASGGTSVGVQVANSSDASCFDATQNVKPDFVYSIVPSGVIVQCQSTRIWWDNSTVQGQPRFQGVIPGGQSFEISEGTITNVAEQGTGFSWVPPLRGMTTLLLVGGDNRGNGTAGSTLTLSAAASTTTPRVSTAIARARPLATRRRQLSHGPHQLEHQHHTSTSSPSNTGGSSTNVGAIAGGVVGGVTFMLALFLVALFFLRRRRMRHTEKVRPDLLSAEDADEGDESTGALPQNFRPEPFLASDTRTSLGGLTADGRRVSGLTDPDGRPISGVLSESRSGTPDPSTSMSTSTRKTAPMRQMRPVNIIQHADAGPSTGQLPEEEDVETVELPPAYTNIKK
ncbi:hypothetical protein B0H10DRAFT_1940781 [Mycena sp. CBHHK59/15]|nr:hypothetical protein B0H10DRAFT_1940781 [Mycena sp. CBHHK59/15]